MLTPEQQLIVFSSGDIKVNAFAGTGKTTTIIEYVKMRPVMSRILYLVFNKSVKLEAIEKFKAQGLNNVVVETAHSLAFRAIVQGSKYKVKPQDYKTYEVSAILGLKMGGQRHIEYIIANHILRYMSMYCNSDKKSIDEVNYLSSIEESKSRIFVATHLKTIKEQLRTFLKKMNKAEIEITHDFYLKKFQLLNPVLNFDYILFDEGQDASGSILQVFMNQKATKVIVGDTHQQIYSWRYAVNSLEKALYKTFMLSCSFRFHPDIANIANAVLRYKNMLCIVPPEMEIKIQGAGKNTSTDSFAVIGRGNIALLHRAISFTKQNPDKTVYFEGNINSYTYADEGASLFDVFYLSINRQDKVRDILISKMASLEDLEAYVQTIGDKQLGMMIEIVKDYGNDIFDLIADLKRKHVADKDKYKADAIFSTVHKSKGQEYDTVELTNDFIQETTIIKNKTKLEQGIEEDEEPVNLERLNEEINLLYVAVTRAKTKLLIPEKIMPTSYNPQTSLVEIIRYEQN